MAQTKILVVEDDAAIRRGLCDALAFAGYAVGEYARGDGAVERALASSPDLLLLDVLLPGTDGFEILRELRASHPQLPVILLTARGAEDDRVRGLKLDAASGRGASFRLVVPVQPTFGGSKNHRKEEP